MYYTHCVDHTPLCIVRSHHMMCRLHTVYNRVRHFGHKLFEMVGSAWILDLLNISDHFAFWTRPLSSLENDVQIFFSLQCKIQGIFLAKKVVGHNFWTEGPTDLRSTFLSCIFDAFLGDTPLDHIFSHMPICPYAHYGHIGVPEKSIKNATQKR